jgi:cell division protease FtsH
VKATNIARSMVLRYGMDKELGHVAYERERQPMVSPAPPSGWLAREFSDETERLVDHAIRALVGHAFDRAIEILNTHRSLHEKTARLLLQKETLEEEDIKNLRAEIAPLGTVDEANDAPRSASKASHAYASGFQNPAPR